MKTKITLIIIFFYALCNAQTPAIPDVNFKNALINSLCVDADLNGTYESDADLNNDGQIQYSELNSIQRLNVSNKNISSLSGLENFSSIKILICNNNLLTSLSLLSPWGLALTTLEILNCSHNNITNLNLYPNNRILNNLKVVNCSFNQLVEVNISYTTLDNLNISNNNLSSIIQYSTSFSNLINLNISNNIFTSYIIDFPSLVTFDLSNNPFTTLTYNRFSNNVIDVSDIATLETLIFNYEIAVPSIHLTLLQNLRYLQLNNATLQDDLVLSNLPSLNSIDFQSYTNNLTLLDNLGFTSINNDGYGTPNSLNVIAKNLHISGTSSITNVNLVSFNVVNFSIDNLPNLTVLKVPGGEVLQSVTLSLLPLLQILEIGRLSSTISPNCIDLTIQNYNNLQTILIQNYNLGSVIIESLPALTSYKNTATSCNNISSSFSLTNLPLLINAEILDGNLSNLNINDLNSLHDLTISSRELTNLNLFTLPQLYNLNYNTTAFGITNSLPILSIQNFPNLHPINLDRLNISAINLNNLPNLYSLISTNNYTGTAYTPQVLNYSISNLPSLFYVQLDEIKTTNLTFLNVPNLNTLKMRKSNIGSSYSFQNLSLENLYIDNMSTLNNFTFNNLPNFKKLNITDCSKIQSFNLGNINQSLQSFLLTTAIYIPSTSITSLNFTNYPQLTSLKVRYKLTNLTLSNLPNLTFLDISQNKLNSISLTNFPQLNEIICNYIQPSSLMFPLILSLPNLTKLDVNYNNGYLSNLDLSNCPLLTELHYLISNASNTGIISFVNLRNGNSNFSIFESNSIKNICVDDNNEKNVLQAINSNLSNTIFTSYCSFNPPGIFYNVNGNSLLDVNNNGCDSTDIVFPMINLNINAGGISNNYIANNSGGYSIPLLQGQYTITPSFENPTYFNFSPDSVNLTFPTSSNPYIQNFCVSPNGNHNDLEINLLPIDSANPGFDANYKLVYKNKGTTSQSGSINFTFDDNVLDFVSSNPNTSTQTTGNISLSFANLLPFESREINIKLNLNSPTEIPALNSGNVLSFIASIIGLTDEIPNDNTFNLAQTVTNSFDPNDKICLEGTAISTDMVGEYVHYLIRFENKGTDNAKNIVVKDVIDINKFDINTLIPIKASHNFETRIFDINKVEFIFQNINLPFDDAHNDGYVSFKIKTKPNLVVGNTFSNSANIYFDYNFPIVTNIYTTTIQNSLSVQENNFVNGITFYPNPVKNILQFKTDINIVKVEIYDIAGRILSSNSISDNKIDLFELKKGNYILKVFTEKEVINTKILKE